MIVFVWVAERKSLETVGFTSNPTNMFVQGREFGENRLLLVSQTNWQISIAEKDWLWPPIKQLWGNKGSITELEDFIKKIISNDSLQNPDKGLWAAMAQLTPGPLELLFNPKGTFDT